MPIRLKDLKKLINSVDLPDDALVRVYDEYNGAAINSYNLVEDKISITGAYDKPPQEPDAVMTTMKSG